MLNIYTSIETTEKKIEKTPWDSYFKNNKITKFFDASDVEIVSNVENTSLLNSDTIHGKFSDMPIGIGNLSEGCKTLLCINHAIKNNKHHNIIFNITSCGGNAISYLASNIALEHDVYVYCAHCDFGHSTNVNIKINDDKVYNDAILASQEYLNIKRGA